MKKIELEASVVAQAKALVGKYTNYRKFSADRKAAFEFTKLVGARVCPYCNINYAYTVVAQSGSLVLRGDIDHFEAQTHQPGKTLDPDNLVPCCQACNSRLKLAQRFHRSTHLHPYVDCFDAIKVFRISLRSVHYLRVEAIELVFARRRAATDGDNDRSERNIAAFRLRERYAMHRSDAVDILRQLKFYHGLRLEEIRRLAHHARELDGLLFGPEIGDINSVPLGKLKQDLLEAYR